MLHCGAKVLAFFERARRFSSLDYCARMSRCPSFSARMHGCVLLLYWSFRYIYITASDQRARACGRHGQAMAMLKTELLARVIRANSFALSLYWSASLFTPYMKV